MKRTVLAAAVSLLFANLALAPSASAGTQQDKMTACNKEAGDKKLSGDERKKSTDQDWWGKEIKK